MFRQVVVFVFICFSYSISAHPGWGLAIDSKGNLYIPDIGRSGIGTLWKLTPEKELIPLLKDFHCHNVNIFPRGELYVANGESEHTLIRMIADNFDTILQTLKVDHFFGGNCTVSPSGNVYFGINNYIWQKFPDGRYEKVSNQYLEWNQAIYVDANECIYFPDIGVGAGVVYRLSPGGNADLIARDLISKLDRPRDRHNDVLLGITKDDIGSFFIAEPAGRKVLQIAPGGEKSTFYQSDPGWYPSAICFQGKTAFIIENSNRGIYQTRIIRVSGKGEIELYFEF